MILCGVGLVKSMLLKFCLEGYMSTYNESYEKYDELYDAAYALFSDYYFTTTIDSAEIVSSNSVDATVNVVQTVRFAFNSDKKDYQTEGLIYLKKDAGGMWTCVNEGTPTITTIDSTK